MVLGQDLEAGFLLGTDRCDPPLDLVQADRIPGPDLVQGPLPTLHELDHAVVAGDGGDLALQLRQLHLELGTLGLELLKHLKHPALLGRQGLEISRGVQSLPLVGEDDLLKVTGAGGRGPATSSRPA